MLDIKPSARPAEKVMMVKNVVGDLLQRRTPHYDRMIRNWDLYIGNHETFKDPRGRHRQIVLNYIAALTDGLVSFFTGQNPEFEPWPEDGSIYSKEVYNLVFPMVKGWWYRHNMKAYIDQIVRDATIYGHAVTGFHPPEDPESFEARLSDFEPWAVDPFSILFDYNSRTWDIQRGNLMGTICMVDKDDVERRYGKKITSSREFYHDIAPERQEETAPFSQDRTTTGRYPSHYDSNGPVSMSADSGEHIRTGYVRNEEVFIQLYFRDFRRNNKHEDLSVADPDTGKRISIPYHDTSEKYPGGIRVISICGDTLLEDSASPWQKGYLRGKFPFALLNHVRRSDIPHGIGFPDKLEDPQILLNKHSGLLFDWLRQMPKSPLIIPKQCGIREGQVSLKPGLKLWPKNAVFSKYIRFLQTPGVPPALIEAIREIMTHMERIGGVPDVTEGRRPAGISAAAAIIALQEKAKQKFQHQVRNVEGFITDLGNGVTAGMEQYYWERRPFYGIDDIGDPQQLTYNKETNFSPAMALSSGRHRIRMRAGSTLDLSKYALEERYMALYDKGIIDKLQLVDALDIPGKERIKQEIIKQQEMAFAAQQAAEAAAAMGMPDGPAAPGLRTTDETPPGKGQPTIGEQQEMNADKKRAEVAG